MSSEDFKSLIVTDPDLVDEGWVNIVSSIPGSMNKGDMKPVPTIIVVIIVLDADKKNANDLSDFLIVCLLI